jgi:hypothetical protein
MILSPLPYHLKVRDHFKQEPGIWDFFTASRTREEQLAIFKTELLKNTYKFQPESDPLIYRSIAIAKEKLGLGDLPVTAYQAQYTHDTELNASIVYLHQEAQLVFSGSLIQMLDERELLAVIAHELSHVKLYTLLEGELEVTDRIITAIANQYNQEAVNGALTGSSYHETARLFQLYTEIYCDRGAYLVLEDMTPVINVLLKIATGLSAVNAESYIRQAEEIFSQFPGTRSSTPTHPENFIRTRALRLWHEQKEAAGPAINRMMEGGVGLDRLDIFMQEDLTGLTRDFLQLYLQPSWFHSTMVLSLAKQYFADLTIGSAAGGEKPAADEETILSRIRTTHPSVREYFSYVLLDFALVDPSLEDIPSGRAFHLAETLQLTEAYSSIVKKELQLSDKKLQQHRQNALAAYKTAKEQ